MRLAFELHEPESGRRVQHPRYWSFGVRRYPLATRLHFGPLDIVWWRNREAR